MSFPIDNASGGRKDPEGHRTSEISVKQGVAGRLGLGWRGQTGTTTCRPKRAMWDSDFTDGKEFESNEDY